MTAKSVRRLVKFTIPMAAALYFVPWLAIFFLVCGMLDIARHKRWSTNLFSRYFAGNGMLTWALSPVNLLLDAISRRHPYELRISDFPEPAQREIREMLDVFDRRKGEILGELRQMMAGKQRGMLFFKWYDSNLHDSVKEFNRDYTYIKTIGVSYFSERESTSVHFGPLRLTVRLLYNLTPRQSDDVFIEVNGKKHFWHDDPLFLFDDTIQHRSVNDEDGERACVFVDVLRPSRFVKLQNWLVHLFNRLTSRFNHMFYKNWDMLGAKT